MSRSPAGALLRPVLCLSLLGLLAACGGGGGGGSSTTASSSGPSLTSLSDYAASSKSSSSAASVASSSLASFTQAANTLTTEALYEKAQSSSASNDFIVTSPVTLSTLSLLGTAAQGSSADEFTTLEARFGPRAQWANLLRSALQNAGIQRTLGAESTTRMAPAFLEASRNVASWSALDYIFTSNIHTRLSVRDELNISYSLASAENFSGVYALGNNRYQVPLLRWTTGVQRLSDSDYSADRMDLADGMHRLISIRPSSGNLASFSKARLAQIIESAQKSSSGLSASSLVLPKRYFSFAINDSGLNATVSTGLSKIFDQTQANLAGFDPRGGHYAQLDGFMASLSLTGSDLLLETRQQYSFIASPYSTSTSGVNVTVDNWPGFTCYPASQTVDLGPQLLLVTNRNTGLIVAAMHLYSPPDGTWLGDHVCP
ncbi:MAG: hypothetical protein QM776_18715 [Rhodocyclaceae bacterium]